MNSLFDWVHPKLRLPLDFGFSAPFAFFILESTTLWFFILLLFGVPVLIVTLISVARSSWMMISFIKNRNLKDAIFASILPFILIFACVRPFIFINTVNYASGVIHFAVGWPYYNYQVSKLAPLNRPKLVVFNWGGMSWASHGLVYDETDQVIAPKTHRTTAWLEQASHSELSCDGYQVRPLWAHYYLADFPC